MGLPKSKKKLNFNSLRTLRYRSVHALRLCEKQKIPGWELVSKGLTDLSEHKYDTVEALLVLMYSPRLIFNGLDIPEHREDKSPDKYSGKKESYNMKLYRILERQGDDAHSKYNALQRRIVSFCSTLEAIL